MLIIKLHLENLPAKEYDINLKSKTIAILNDFIASNHNIAYVTDFDYEYISLSACETAFRYSIKSKNLPIITMQKNGKVMLEYIYNIHNSHLTAPTITSKWFDAFQKFISLSIKSAPLSDFVSYDTEPNKLCSAQSVANRQATKYNLPIIVYRKNNMLFISRSDL